MDELPHPLSFEPNLAYWQEQYAKALHTTGLAGQALAKHLAMLHDVPFAAIPSGQPTQTILSQMPKSLLTRYPIIALLDEESPSLHLAVFYPYPDDFLRDWQFFSNRPCQPVIISKTQWDNLWQTEQRLSNARAFHDAETQDQTVIAWLEALLSESIAKNCSDLHFEPQQAIYRVRARIDGRLSTVQKIPEELAQRALSRVKILANLDIAERRLPQDGGFHNSFCGKTVHFRVSTCPVMDGEKLVIRILNKHLTALMLDNLGMPPNILHAYRRLLHKPQGMILVTGPTGSGKSVTLYASLSELNQGDCNIATIEDPVEMQIAGLNQVRVNLKSGLDFPDVLRALLRQDPDIIMVGEIRDSITAEIAVRAAQTGHLLLSTIHSNSAPQTLIRLVNMGIPAYQICGALRCVIAQRLLRKLCIFCKEPMVLRPEQTGLASPITAFSPKQCEHCHEGYHGRLAVFEYLEMNDTLEALFLSNPTLSTLRNYLREHRIPRLQDAALALLVQGETSLSEIQRIIDMDLV